MTQSTNVKAAESIIRDVDYAKESANFNKQNIISQAGSYAISQANSVQQNVLKLLQKKGRVSSPFNYIYSLIF